MNKHSIFLKSWIFNISDNIYIFPIIHNLPAFLVVPNKFETSKTTEFLHQHSSDVIKKENSFNILIITGRIHHWQKATLTFFIKVEMMLGFTIKQLSIFDNNVNVNVRVHPKKAFVNYGVCLYIINTIISGDENGGNWFAYVVLKRGTANELGTKHWKIA